jgi:hypothetical protein
MFEFLSISHLLSFLTIYNLQEAVITEIPICGQLWAYGQTAEKILEKYLKFSSKGRFSVSTQMWPVKTFRKKFSIFFREIKTSTKAAYFMK